MRAAGWGRTYTHGCLTARGRAESPTMGRRADCPRAKGPTPKSVRLGSQGCFTGCVRIHAICCPHAFCTRECPHTKDPPRATRVPPRAFYYTPVDACVLRIVCRDVAPTGAHVLRPECILIIDIFWVFMVVCCCRTPDIVVLQYRCALV
jgi:hypothetical protein